MASSIHYLRSFYLHILENLLVYLYIHTVHNFRISFPHTAVIKTMTPYRLISTTPQISLIRSDLFNTTLKFSTTNCPSRHSPNPSASIVPEITKRHYRTSPDK